MWNSPQPVVDLVMYGIDRCPRMRSVSRGEDEESDNAQAQRALCRAETWLAKVHHHSKFRAIREVEEGP
jgi:hypothetical protein